MRIIFSICSALLMTMMLLSACKNTTTGAGAILLKAPAYHDKLEATPDARLIDVRTPEEFREGHLPASININWEGDAFKEEVTIFDKSQPIFVYCEAGGRGTAAAKYLSEQGFKEVYNLDGGFAEWQTVYPTLVEK